MTEPLDGGPFFHGTTADVSPGETFTPGHQSNYNPAIVMNHIYFTSRVDGAGFAAEIAAELAGPHATPRVYEVEPTGPFEDDPNVTDKKFPGNPTRSFRSAAPLTVTSEITDWNRLTPEQLAAWRDTIVNRPPDQRGEIIN